MLRLYISNNPSLQSSNMLTPKALICSSSLRKIRKDLPLERDIYENTQNPLVTFKKFPREYVCILKVIVSTFGNASGYPTLSGLMGLFIWIFATRKM